MLYYAQFKATCELSIMVNASIVYNDIINEEYSSKINECEHVLKSCLLTIDVPIYNSIVPSLHRIINSNMSIGIIDAYTLSTIIKVLISNFETVHKLRNDPNNNMDLVNSYISRAYDLKLFLEHSIIDNYSPDFIRYDIRTYKFR